MSTVEFITALFYEVDEQMGAIPKHPEAHLWPSEVVPWGCCMRSKAGGNRAFYRWLTTIGRCFPSSLSAPGSFAFMTHQDWTQVFLPLDRARWVIDTYGIEPLHPMREGRSPQQIGRKGLSNHRWIVGGTVPCSINALPGSNREILGGKLRLREHAWEGRVSDSNRCNRLMRRCLVR